MKPGPVPGPGNTLQAPHILFSIFAAGLVLMLMTLIFNVIGFSLTRRFREAY